MILLEGIIFLKEDLKVFEIHKEVGKLFEKSKFNYIKGKLYYKKKYNEDENIEAEIEAEIRKYYHLKDDLCFATLIFENKSNDDEIESFEVIYENIKDDIKQIRKVFYLGEDKQDIYDNMRIEKIIFIKDEYAKFILNKSYSLIYDIKNYMRELIFKVMSFKANKDWFKKELPENIEIKQDRKYLEVFGLDFSHLSSIIFDRNEKSKLGDLYERLESAQNCNDLDLKEIQKLIPKSNWQKYFSDINISEKISNIKTIEYNNIKLSNEETIKRLLNDINQLRNKIAHNNLYIKNDFYNNLNRKVNFLKEWIDYALEYLHSNILENTKERIYNNLNNQENELIKTIDNLIIVISTYYNVKGNKINSLKKIEFFNKKTRCLRQIKFYINLKKRIMNNEVELGEDDILNHVETLKELIKNIKNCPKFEYREDEQIFLEEEF